LRDLELAAGRVETVNLLPVPILAGLPAAARPRDRRRRGGRGRRRCCGSCSHRRRSVVGRGGGGRARARGAAGVLAAAGGAGAQGATSAVTPSRRRGPDADFLRLSLRGGDEPRLTLRDVVLDELARVAFAGRVRDERRNVLVRSPVLAGEVADAGPQRRRAAVT